MEKFTEEEWKRLREDMESVPFMQMSWRAHYSVLQDALEKGIHPTHVAIAVADATGCASEARNFHCSPEDNVAAMKVMGEALRRGATTCHNQAVRIEIEHGIHVRIEEAI